jgi:Domain of unknown function (4846)
MHSNIRLLGCLVAALTALSAALALGRGSEAPAPALAEAQPRPPTRAERARYPWLSGDAVVRPLEAAFPPPAGYTRVAVEPDSFGAWLRGLPLRPEGTPVRDYAGGQVLAGEDSRLAAVAELDVGRADLQQCADSIIRLHAEWLWAGGQKERIAYRFTSGHLAEWPRYAAGERARISGNQVAWVRGAAADGSRAAFRDYLSLVFTYAGTLSLQTEKGRPGRESVRPGDFFVLGGSPGTPCWCWTWRATRGAGGWRCSARASPRPRTSRCSPRAGAGPGSRWRARRWSRPSGSPSPGPRCAGSKRATAPR